ncbi:uracil-DNA glycosylase [Synergistales bacterium]|nr:uracil-DNA glycosylase [Synergistales bacterium]
MTDKTKHDAAWESAWGDLRARVAACEKCGLCQTRTNTVFGQGNVYSPLVFVGEGPGAEEDEKGLAFVGEAGRLLTKILSSGDIDRENAFIANVVKCRPPENRNPLPEEMLACGDWLEAQLLLLRPKILVCLGAVAAKWILKTTEGITSLRGRWFDWRGIWVFAMFHPSYLLRNDSRSKGSPKELTWHDVRDLKKRLDSID